MLDVFFADVDVPEFDGDVLKFWKAQERGQLVDLALLRVLDLVTKPLASLVVNDSSGCRRSHDESVKLHPTPCVLRGPRYWSPLAVVRPLAFESDCTFRKESA